RERRRKLPGVVLIVRITPQTKRISILPFAGRTPSVPVEADQRRLRQSVSVDVEADGGRRGVGVDVELVDVEGVDGDVVVVRLARRRAGAAVARLAVVVANLDRSLRQPRSAPRALRQPGCAGRQVE